MTVQVFHPAFIDPFDHPDVAPAAAPSPAGATASGVAEPALIRRRTAPATPPSPG